MNNNQKTIDELIESGELGVMTECAYGAPIADSELENKLKKKTEKDNKK